MSPPAVMECNLQSLIYSDALEQNELLIIVVLIIKNVLEEVPCTLIFTCLAASD